MTVVATILKAGADTSVQDAGRTAFRHLGTPQSGAADRLSFALANAAVGNAWDAPALECAGVGPDLQFTAETAIALTGADMSATMNETPVEAFRVHHAKPGDILKLGAAKTGLRAYIAIAGGVFGRNELGGVATYAPAGIGGVEGRLLRAGDSISCADAPVGSLKDIAPSDRPVIANDTILRIVRGPEFHLIDAAAQKKFLSEALTVSRRGNRMGVELIGPTVHPPKTFSMLSSPVYPGTIQCPPSGNPYLLLADAQTVGGYARIGQVIDADLHLAGQIRPGARVWFSAVSAESARATTAHKAAFYRDYLPKFRFG